MTEVTDRHGKWAVRYARDVLSTYLTAGTTPEPDSVADPLAEERGAFVTLEKNDSLRGCIGRPYPRQPAYEAVRQSAVEAGTGDPRFSRVTDAELDEITIEVSVLTPPTSLSQRKGALADVIDVGRDGLIVRADGRSGLLLPQVAVDRPWAADTFLTQTCRKAGLPDDCWRRDGVTVKRFQAQVFEESSPRGPIENATVELATGP